MELESDLLGMWVGQDKTEEEQLFRESIRRFVIETINPMVFDAKKDYKTTSRKLYRKAGERGILSLSIPQELGGQGGTAVLQGIAREEMGRGKVIGYGLPWPLSWTHVNFAEGCSDDLVKKWMPRFLSGESRLGLASTEPRSGSDVASIVANGVKEGDKYIINGEKGPLSGVSTTDAFIILARTGTNDAGARGVTAFFAEADCPGIEYYQLEAMEDSADLGGFRMNNLELSLDHVVGEEGKGFYQQMKAFDIERAIMPMAYLGATMDSLELSLEYAKNREVWGRPIATYEGVMFPLIEAVTKVESIRSFCYQVLKNYDQGKRITKEAAMMRWYVTRVCLDALDACIQVNGAQGYTDNVPHQRRYRWVRAGLFGHGTQEIQKLVIAREILGKEIYDQAIGRK